MKRQDVEILDVLVSADLGRYPSKVVDSSATTIVIEVDGGVGEGLVKFEVFCDAGDWDGILSVESKILGKVLESDLTWMYSYDPGPLLQELWEAEAKKFWPGRFGRVPL